MASKRMEKDTPFALINTNINQKKIRITIFDRVDFIARKLPGAQRDMV